tara:strand:+ start:889 stop:1560 length:672 start_codon:yes stop_codon:yes gene_type:complete
MPKANKANERRVDVDASQAGCREGLFVAPTKLKSASGDAYPFMGLFTSRKIPAGGFIGFYCGKFEEAKEGSKSKSHYNMRTDSFRVKVVKGSLSPQAYPLAFANEPGEGSRANTFSRVYYDGNKVSPRLRSGVSVEALVLHACQDIGAGKEILFHYGKTYDAIRRLVYEKNEHGHPRVGHPCTLAVKYLELPASYISKMRKQYGDQAWKIPNEPARTCIQLVE